MKKTNISIRDIRFHVQGMESFGVADLDIEIDSYVRDVADALNPQSTFGWVYAP